MKKALVCLFALVLLVPTLLPLPAAAAAHSAGTNVKTSDGTIYLITNEGTRRPYNSAGAFLSYRFNTWANVKTASSEDLYLPVGTNIAPQDGRIICDTKQRVGTCYVMSAGWKVGFPSADIFYQQGFSFKNALHGDVSFLMEKQNIEYGDQAHFPGVLINKNGTIYLIGEYGLIGIPSMDVFWSWGYELSDVVIANNSDSKYAVTTTLSARQPGQLSPLVSPGNTVAYSTNESVYPSVKISPYGPKSQISAGKSNVEIFSFVISAPASTAITVSQIGLDFSGSVPISNISNLKITHWETSTQIGSNSGYSLQYGGIGIAILPELTIPAGTSAEFVVKADIAAAANGYTLQSKLTQIWTTVPGGQSAGLATVSGIPLSGTTLNLVDTTATAPIQESKSISVTSPLKGDTIQAGNTKQITWTSTLPSSTVLDIYISGKSDASGSYIDQKIATSTSNTGYFNWSVPTTLPTGSYVLVIYTPDYKNYGYNDGEFKINNPYYVQPMSERDARRLADIRQMASAMELYFNDNNMYPPTLSQLTYPYMGTIPTAPTPNDGTCTSAQNTYTYTQLGNGQSYILTFCLGGYTGGYSAGFRILSPSGIQ